MRVRSNGGMKAENRDQIEGLEGLRKLGMAKAKG